jgi:hypothetical protein
MLTDKRDESDYGEQRSQGVSDFPLRSIGRPVGGNCVDCPSVDRLIHRLIEDKEVGEHRHVTECRDDAGAPRAAVMPPQHEQSKRGKERQDFHRSERLAPPTIEMLLDAEPQRAIQFELRDHLKRVRYRRRCGDEGDDQIDGSQGAHTTSRLRTEPPAVSNQLRARWPSHSAAQSEALCFNNFVRQLVCVCRRSRKMHGQHLADFVNRFCERVAEFFILKMDAHSIHNVLPELFAAFFVNRLVADNGKFVGPRRDENKDGVALAGLVHSETLKFLLGNRHRIRLESAALNINANFAGGFRFRFTNRAHNSCMLKPAEKVSRSHRSPTRSRASAAKTPASTAEPAKSAATSTAR